MEMSIILLNQVAVVFLLIVVGYVITKMKFLDDGAVNKLTDILLMIVTPAIVINAFQKDFEIRMMKNLLVAVILAFIVHIIGIIVSSIIFKKEETGRYKVSRFSAIYSNCGYMGLPLLSAVLGSDGVFFGSAYLVVLSVLYWTQGVHIYTQGKEKLSFKKIFLNPGVLGTLIGLLFFFVNFRLPYIVSQTIGHIANLNTPVAMFILGKYMTEVDFKKIITNFEIYKISFARLILIPVVVLIILKVLPIDETVKKTLIISASCPVATSSALIANKFGGDAIFASEAVSFSTLLSIITIPLIVFFL